MKTGPHTPPGGSGRGPTLQQRLQARAAIKAHNAARPLLPKCGARKRSNGEPCRDIAMANGRCYRHGGRTPSGAAWHRMVVPNGDRLDAVQKLDAKLRDHRKAERKRATRVAAMTPEELAAYRAWKRSHQSGTSASRARTRQERDHAAAARELVARPPRPPSPELLELEAKIEEQRAIVARLNAKLADDGEPKYEGAFA